MHCDGGILRLELTHSQRHFISGSEDGTLRSWAVAGEKEAWKVELPKRGWCTAIAISPDDALIASNFGEGAVQLWNAKNGEPVAKLKGHSDLGAVAFSPDGAVLLSGGRDATIRAWSVETKKELHRLELPATARVFDLEFSPDGASFAAPIFNLATGKSTTLVWNAKTYELVRELKGHTNIIWSLAWAPDGLSLVTASADKSIRRWPLAAKAKATVLKGHQGVVRRVRFSPDGATILSSCSNGTLRLWNAASGAERAVHTFDHGVQAFDVFDDGARVILGLSPPGSKNGVRSELEIRSV